jgi:hypothetical protein
MTELSQKLTNQSQSVLPDHSRIRVGIEVSHRIPQDLIVVVSRPAECYQPVDRFLVHGWRDLLLLHSLLKEPPGLKTVSDLGTIFNLFSIFAEIREP